MSAMTNTPAHKISVFTRIHAVFASVKEALARNAVYKKTVRELSSLSDHELSDIGIARCDIYAIARQA